MVLYLVMVVGVRIWSGAFVDVVWVFERRFVTRGCERELRPGGVRHLTLLFFFFCG
jgi:hypothetical protein